MLVLSFWVVTTLTDPLTLPALLALGKRGGFLLFQGLGAVNGEGVEIGTIGMALAEMGHAGFGQHTIGSGVLGIGDAHDAGEVGVRKGVGDELTGELGGIATPPAFLTEVIEDLDIRPTVER